jgi:hypothetical protein
MDDYYFQEPAKTLTLVYRVPEMPKKVTEKYQFNAKKLVIR